MKWNLSMPEKKMIISKFKISNNNQILEVKELIKEDLYLLLEEINKQVIAHNITTVFNIDNISEHAFYSLSQSSKDAINSSNIIINVLKKLSFDLKDNLDILVDFSGTIEFYEIPENMEWDFDDIDFDSLHKFEDEVFIFNKSGSKHIETHSPLVVHEFAVKETIFHSENPENEPVVKNRTQRLQQITGSKPFIATEK